MDNENKTSLADSNIPPGFEEFVDKLKAILEDLLSLDVITATSDFNGELTNPSNLVKSLSNLEMTNTNIHARTQIQISGDRAEIFPKKGEGSLSQMDIWNYHQNTAALAECIWLRRMDYIIKLIIALMRSKRGDILPADLLYTPSAPTLDNCISQVLTRLKSNNPKNNNPTTENNPTP